MDEKAVRWQGSSYKDLCEFPERAREDAGYQLGFIQQGFDPADWKPMRSIGTGVREIRIHAGGEYRVIYTAKFRDVIYVLHAFQKKTQRAPKRDIEIARKRYSEIRQERAK